MTDEYVGLGDTDIFQGFLLCGGTWLRFYPSLAEAKIAATEFGLDPEMDIIYRSGGEYYRRNGKSWSLLDWMADD